MTSDTPDTGVVRPRRVVFRPDPDRSMVWNPERPDFALAANALSLLMPAVEPYVIRAVRSGRPAVAPDLRGPVDAFIRQEAAHQAQHRAFNDRLLEEFPGLRRVERLVLGTYRTVERRTSDRFGMAFAAGSEAIAFALARWVARRADDLLPGSDPVVAGLFVWHLAEEVEHKSVAIDVYRHNGGGTARYVAASLLSLLLLGLFTWLGVFTLLVATGRWWRPDVWARLLVWAVGVAFEILPAMAVSALDGHHPSELADPDWFGPWLEQLAVDDEVVAEEWTLVGAVPHRTSGAPAPPLTAVDAP